MTKGANMEEKPNAACRILDALREIEFLIADLYGRFALSFAEDRELWEGLKREEEGHAALADSLKGLLREADVPAALGKVHLAALETYKKGLDYQIGRLGRGELGRKNALFIARDLERTLVERMYYDLLRGGDADSESVKERIRSETESHFGRLEEYIAGVAGGDSR